MFVKFRPVIFTDHIPLFNLFGSNVLKVGVFNNYMSIDPSHLLDISVCLQVFPLINTSIVSFQSCLKISNGRPSTNIVQIVLLAICFPYIGKL